MTKIKTIFLSLMAIATITVFLSSCEEDYPEGYPLNNLATQNHHKILSEKFTDYKVIELDIEKIYDEVKAKAVAGQFELTLPNGTDKPWNLTLARNKVINENSRGQDKNGNEVDISDIITLDGYLTNNMEDVVRLVVTNKLIGGFVNDGGFNQRIGPLAEYAPGAKMSEFIIYEANDYKFNDLEGDCSSHTMGNDETINNDVKIDYKEFDAYKNSSAHTLQLRLYTDKAVLDDVSIMFPDATLTDKLKVTRFFVALLVNGASAKYHNSLNLELSIKHVVTLLGTSFAKGNNVKELNGQLKDYLNNLGDVRNHQDAVVLISNKRMSGDTAGIVDEIGAICKYNNERSYTAIRNHDKFGKSYSQPFKENLLAHEIGHILGARHPVESDGRVNCGINSGPFPISNTDTKSSRIMWRNVPNSSIAIFDNCAKDYMNLHLFFNGSCL